MAWSSSRSSRTRRCRCAKSSSPTSTSSRPSTSIPTPTMWTIITLGTPSRRRSARPSPTPRCSATRRSVSGTAATSCTRDCTRRWSSSFSSRSVPACACARAAGSSTSTSAAASPTWSRSSRRRTSRAPCWSAGGSPRCCSATEAAMATIGEKLPSLDKEISQRQIDAYSGVRPLSIHTDEAWARAKGFRTCLAQGMMSTAYVSEMMTRLLGAGFVKGGTADAGWQTVRAAVDADRVGRGVTGATNRAAWIVTGVTHFGLAIAAFKIALGIRQSTAETGVKRWTELIMSIPFGPWLVAALGIVVVGVGLVMFYRAWTGDVDRWLNLTELPPTIRAIVMGLVRFGLVARGVVPALAGLFLVVAAIQLRPEDARGLGGTLRTIQYQPEGRLLLGIIALGFISNGILELVRARYREIRIT